MTFWSPAQKLPNAGFWPSTSCEAFLVAGQSDCFDNGFYLSPDACLAMLTILGKYEILMIFHTKYHVFCVVSSEAGMDTFE